MRDALGALGPVDGINPELSNLTLSITMLQKGDIVLIASDGLTDNFDPNVCKFSSNLPESKKKQNPPSNEKKSIHANEIRLAHAETKVQTDAKRRVAIKSNSLKRDSLPEISQANKTKPPVKPPRKNYVKNKETFSRTSSEKTESDSTEKEVPVKKNEEIVLEGNCVQEKSVSETNHEANRQNTEIEPEIENPLIAQFMRENSLDETKTKPTPNKHTSSHSTTQHSPRRSSSPKTTTNVGTRSKTTTRTTKTYDTKQRPKSPPPKKETQTNPKKTDTKSNPPPKHTFLRSKTSLDMKTRPILRNEEGIPYITPIQRYELTLLLMEDVLKKGISGTESQCVSSKKLCENLVSFTVSITSAKRHTLEDNDLYFDNRNGVLTEVSAHEKKIRRRRGLERVQNLPGKLDHVSVVAYNVGNFSF